MCYASQLAANEHKCLNKSNTSVFQLKQELVNFSSSNAISIAIKLDSSLKDFQCQSSISANTKANSAKLNEMPTSQRSTLLYFNSDCRIHLLVRFWGCAHSNFMQQNYFPSTWVNCCFNFVCQLPVDCWTIFYSESWGSTWSANHTLFSLLGRSKSIICFWQIHLVLTED